MTLDRDSFRRALVTRLESDLFEAGAPGEVLLDRPSDRYMTGILYPQESEVTSEEDDDFATGGEGQEQGLPESEDGVPLAATLKPASAGLSFAIRGTDGRAVTATFEVRCGTYSATETTTESEGAQGTRSFSWQRREHCVVLDNLRLISGPISLAAHGLVGMQLYLQVGAEQDDTLDVTAALVNTQERGETRNESEERSFFQVGLRVRPGNSAQFIARPSRRSVFDEDTRSSALIYRAAREIATGHTCAADWTESDGRILEVSTSWFPTAVVPAVSPHGAAEFLELGAGNTPHLSSSWLAECTPDQLASSLMLLDSCYRRWIERQGARIDGLPLELQEQAKQHLASCDVAANRIRQAIALFERDPNARIAFQLAQRAMALQRHWAEGDADLVWYPFQLAFQLVVLPSLADEHHADREVMDLLWFPTGGGKTEAYLGLTAFLLFHRRLTNEAPNDGAGVAAIMRYTLRLLTTQQFQRAAAMVCACEHLRRGRPELPLGSVPFSIGLWVGNGATPATVQEARNLQANSPVSYRQIPHCPCCRGGIKWKIDTAVRALCENSSCAFSNGGPHLPVWSVDEDVYRETPSVLIATVDKFAQIVRKAETARLFGLGVRLPAPDFIVQDELHLISGPLGSLTGLYETAIDLLCSRSGRPPKMVGSTATIRRATDQIRQLFARTTAQFPPPGLDAQDSGFAVVNPTAPGRLYVGVTSAGRSAKYAVQAISAALLQAVNMASASAEVQNRYWTLVGYFNTLRELGGALTLMQDDVPGSIEQYAARHGETPRHIEPPAELTSRVSSADVGRLLAELQLPCTKDGAHDILLASSMISVGVDIPRLGLMLVVGQPKTISEYIQSTSRVGRRGPGLVVALYNAGRIRDRAHFETFRTWHDALYREVEATSVTPFAPRAQDKALHSVLVALVRHLAPGMLDTPLLAGNGPALARAEELIEQVERRVSVSDPAEKNAVGAELRNRLEEWSSQVGLRTYWDDYGKQPALMMSAEQNAAIEAAGEGPRLRALWPTPNSMRAVEPGVPFRLVEALKISEIDHGEAE